MNLKYNMLFNVKNLKRKKLQKILTMLATEEDMSKQNTSLY